MLPFSPSQLPIGLRDERVLGAMERVPRAAFVPGAGREEVERDVALSIGHGQTISQPFIVAYMTAGLALKPGMRVLEIGTGSGYQTAILAEMGVEVFSIELIPELHARARETLQKLGLLDRVHLRLGDGRHGWAAHAPFDGVIVTAAPEKIPPALIEQLKLGGRIAIPVGASPSQELRILAREANRLREIFALSVRFVPLVKPEVLA